VFPRPRTASSSPVRRVARNPPPNLDARRVRLKPRLAYARKPLWEHSPRAWMKRRWSGTVPSGAAIVEPAGLWLTHRGHRRAGRPASGGSRIASGASRLCRPHCGDPVFVDLDDVAAGVCAAREPFEAFRSPEDDRVGVGAGLDLVPLFELPVEERVQPVPAGTEGIDLAHGREYLKPPVSEIGGTGLRGYRGAVCAAGRDAFVRVVCEWRAVGAVEVYTTFLSRARSRTRPMPRAPLRNRDAGAVVAAS
jgi:hypothetical protein